MIGLILACQSPPPSAKVIKVIDGDTIVINGGFHVRYIGIDAPEIGNTCYMDAKRTNIELVQGKEVRLQKDVSEKDRHGRLLCYVFINEMFVNAEMVRRGYAYAKTYLPNTKYQVFLKAMEKEAQQTKRGIWK